MSSKDNERPGPHVLVLFGATGDLAARKLFPGFYHLWSAGLMPEDFRIIGSGRHSPGTDDEFRQQVRDALDEHGREEVTDERWDEFAPKVSFTASSAEDADDLKQAVESAESDLQADDADVRRLVYLSVPPSAMEDMVVMLGRTGIAERARLVMEKPFGTDLDSARHLDETLHGVVEEDQVFRIDHFIGKEATQNLLALRFANGLFEPAWNRDHISYVQIDVPEDLGLEGRGSFYESTGAFKDMIVTHLFQLLGFVALEPPVRLSDASLHDERAKLFEGVRLLDPSEVVFGQFEGYQDEEDVEEGSQVETFVALRAWVDTWRWSGVPFLLRTGKAMAEGRQVITIGFKEPPLNMFGEYDDDATPTTPNELVIDLKSDDIRIELRAKVPGPSLDLGSASMQLDIADAFAEADGLEPYERLLHDVMAGDHLLFTRAEEVERLWEVCQPVLDDPPEAKPYAKGSWGPEAAAALAGDRGWRLGEPDGS